MRFRGKGGKVETTVRKLWLKERLPAKCITTEQRKISQNIMEVKCQLHFMTALLRLFTSEMLSFTFSDLWQPFGLFTLQGTGNGNWLGHSRRSYREQYREQENNI